MHINTFTFPTYSYCNCSDAIRLMSMTDPKGENTGGTFCNKQMGHIQQKANKKFWQ